MPLLPLLLSFQVGSLLVALVMAIAGRDLLWVALFAVPAAVVLLLGGLIGWALERRRPLAGARARRMLLRFQLPCWLVAQPVLLFYSWFAGWFSLSSHSPFRWEDAALAYGALTAGYLVGVALPVAVAGWAWMRRS